ncbi:DUF2142 domain-containing protein [Cellulomonas sp. NPDC089187]|uniref:DUF2142 domain-containing protein n=1 Tax=Cellulomonas sp. NPDC089187 TaxID=3154970 RepID=UPI003425158F
MIAVVFAAQAGLLAITMGESLYDEPYHLKAIRYFAHGGSPWGAQPDTLVGVGDVERYGSYLYHWLLSYPWRWSAGLGFEDQRVVVRLVTVGIVTGALFAIRRLGRVMGLSGLASNVVVLLVAAVPMTTFLAATVNYDNLAFLLLPLMWIPAVRLLRADRIDGYAWALFLMAAAALSISKYTMLPLIAVTGIGVLVAQARVLVRRRGRALSRWRWRTGPIAATVGALVAVAAVVERYVLNVVRYGTVQPDCADVQSVSICMTWGPWGRNFELDAAYPDDPFSVAGLFDFVTHDWLPGMMTSWTLFPVRADDAVSATNGAHVLGTILVIAVVGVLALPVLGPRAALARPAGLTLLLASGGYLAALLVENYAAVRELGEVLGVQGRYLQPLLAPILILAARSLTMILAANGRGVGIAMRWGGAVLLAVGLSQTAGLIGVLARSDTAWFRDTGATGVIEHLRDSAQAMVLDDELIPDLRRLAVDPEGG